MISVYVVIHVYGYIYNWKGMVQTMHIKTRVFGEVDIEESKIITFEKGIIGFPHMKHFALVYDEEKGVNAGIRYLQSLEEPEFAMPVMDPLLIIPEYNPEVEDEMIRPLGEITQENLFVLVTVSVPRDIKKISVNLQAPIIINTDERKAAQIIVEGSDYKVKYPIYDILQERKNNAEKKGD